MVLVVLFLVQRGQLVTTVLPLCSQPLQLQAAGVVGAARLTQYPVLLVALVAARLVVMLAQLGAKEQLGREIAAG